MFSLTNLMSDSDHESLLEDPNPNTDVLLETTSSLSGIWHRSARIALCGGSPPDKSDFLLSQLKDCGITPIPGLHPSQLHKLVVQAVFCDPTEYTLLPVQDVSAPTGPISIPGSDFLSADFLLIDPPHEIAQAHLFKLKHFHSFGAPSDEKAIVTIQFNSVLFI